jgi:integrase
VTQTSSSNSGGARARIDRVDRFESARTHSPNSNLRLDERVAVLRDRLDARADSRAAEQLRGDVREARAHVRDWSADRAVSDDTASRYVRVVQQMRDANQRPEDAACKSTFEFRRAALVHETRASLKEALRGLDKAKRSGDLNSAADAYNRVRSGLETLRQYPPSTGSREDDLARSSAFHGPSRPPSDRSNSKRASFANLPDDWRDDVQCAANDYDRPALAVMSLTGCRPAEVRGLKVRQDADSLTLEIRGAKHDEDRGVKVRSISIEKSELSQSQAGRDLQEWIGNRECRTVTHRGSVSAFRERIARSADRAGYDDVTAYTYRHAEARELKNAEISKEEIANRLGHRSERSQSVYG